MNKNNQVDVATELGSIKTEILNLVNLSQTIYERILKLESVVDNSRKRAAPNEVDSDAFSEDDHQWMQSKAIKLEQRAKTQLTSSLENNNNDIESSGTRKSNADTKIKPSLFTSSSSSSSSRPNTSSSRQSSSSASSDSKISAAKSTASPFNYENNRMVVYTDGSCFNNGKVNAKGGIGVYWYDNSPLNVAEPLSGKQSNNRAELQAAVKALKIVREKNFGPVQIRTDSGYVKMGITSWIKTWKKNGWRTATKNAVKNVEDWQELDAMQSALDVEFEWVEAHKGIHGNEMADQLANEGARKN